MGKTQGIKGIIGKLGDSIEKGLLRVVYSTRLEKIESHIFEDSKKEISTAEKEIKGEIHD